jgi:hypothetical protein
MDLAAKSSGWSMVCLHRPAHASTIPSVGAVSWMRGPGPGVESCPVCCVLTSPVVQNAQSLRSEAEAVTISIGHSVQYECPYRDSPQSTQSAGPVRFLIFCSISISLSG